MRTITKAMQFIEIQAQYFNLDSKQLYSQTKSLLMLYRNVVWSVQNRANNLQNEISGTYGMQLNTALMYLSDFAPDRAKEDFEITVSNLFQSHWLIKLIDLALRYVYDYPIYGETYANILKLRFLEEAKRNDSTVVVYRTAEIVFAFFHQLLQSGNRNAGQRNIGKIQGTQNLGSALLEAHGCIADLTAVQYIHKWIVVGVIPAAISCLLNMQITTVDFVQGFFRVRLLLGCCWYLCDDLHDGSHIIQPLHQLPCGFAKLLTFCSNAGKPFFQI